MWSCKGPRNYQTNQLAHSGYPCGSVYCQNFHNQRSSAFFSAWTVWYQIILLRPVSLLISVRNINITRCYTWSTFTMHFLRHVVIQILLYMHQRYRLTLMTCRLLVSSHDSYTMSITWWDCVSFNSFSQFLPTFFSSYYEQIQAIILLTKKHWSFFNSSVADLVKGAECCWFISFRLLSLMSLFFYNIASCRHGQRFILCSLFYSIAWCIVYRHSICSIIITSTVPHNSTQWSREYCTHSYVLIPPQEESMCV